MISLGFSIPLPNSFPSSSINAINHTPIRTKNSNVYNRALSISLSKSSNNKILCRCSSYGEREKRERDVVVMAEEEEYLEAGLRSELMPEHVAVIMDGNRRWAAERDLWPILGHRAGRQAMKQLIRLCCKWRVKVLTVFAFSSENWTRPQEEVDLLMALFEDTMKNDSEEIKRHGCRQTVIGDRTMLPKSLQDAIAYAEKTTNENSRIQVNYAINYSGRSDIIQACKSIANKVKNGLVLPANINEKFVQEELETKYIKPPSPDILIRTSGELRISNFMLWQLAYSELFFVQKLFPDFDETDLLEALRSFQETKKETHVMANIARDSL